MNVGVAALHGDENDFLHPWPQPPNVSVHVSEPWVTNEEMREVADCIAAGWIGSASPWVSSFERLLSERIGQECLSVANGSVALDLALTALGVGPGDEVIVPALTYAATASAVIHCGAVPVFVDVDHASWTIDASLIDAAVSRKTKAVIAVHTYGVASDVRTLREFCDARGLALIEDVAEAFGGQIDGSSLGTFGDAATFSFFANKLIACGEGGAVTARDQSVLDRMRLLRGQGADPSRRYFFLEPGFNFRMPSLSAAVGVAQLRRYDAIWEKRSHLESRYAEELGPAAARPSPSFGDSRVPWIFTAQLNLKPNVSTSQIAAQLAEFGIETRPVFFPLPLMPAFRSAPCTGCRVASEISSRGLSLPTSHRVLPSDVSRICDLILRSC